MKNLTKKEKDFICSFITKNWFLETTGWLFEDQKDEEIEFKNYFKINLKDLDKVCDSIKNKLS